MSARDRRDPTLDRFASARLWAAARAPYLAHALFALTPVVLEPRLDGAGGEPVADPDFRALPADTRWNVHLDPGTVAATPVEESGWWLLHGIGHLVRRHAERSPDSEGTAGTAGPGRDSGPASGGGGDRDREARLWNWAADAEVNDDLEAEGLPVPDGVLSPRALGLPEGRMAEEYVSLIEVLEEAHSRGGRSVADPVDCGGAVHGTRGPAASAGASGGLDPLERDLLELALAREITARAAARTGVPGGWLRWARERLRPSVDWRARLGAVVRRGAHRAAGRTDFSYRRPSRRPGPRVRGGTAVLPSMVAPAPEVAVVVDTSGSIPDPVLEVFLAETAAVLARVCGPGRRLRVVCCDLRAHPVQTVRRAAEIRLVGGGGTDLREGIAAAVATRPRPDLLLVLTDGHTPWPDRPPAVPVAVGLVGGPAAPPPPPDWAHVVPLPADPRHGRTGAGAHGTAPPANPGPAEGPDGRRRP
ncbi:VWA-like domain-containing protein [Nocardiopsis sp. HUAS JQ3]|uniref:vWA domain-containing protein n=1 Tax=Nocardiopsis sp. HUAS JQ3 TaxID=3061629 RepID=UPI0023A9EDD3|nr:VWA-like domain-containing protein [Nocardiopsis sp. HUAS JQ3]WDZ89109.1 VWA-like domain-containing protein [Nocardiopsis sp. HUAS JQ3]